MSFDSHMGDRLRLRTVGSIDDMRTKARRRLPIGVFDAIEGAAGAELTARANLAAFEALSFRARNLTGVSETDISTTLFGERLSVPVMLSPAGGSMMAHPHGECGAAVAAGEAGTIFCVPIVSNRRLEEVVEVATGPLWLQIFPWQDDRALAGTIDRARELGFAALVLTVDCQSVGNHERDIRNGATLPPKVTVRNAVEAAIRPRWTTQLLRGRMLRFPNLDELVGPPDMVPSRWSTPGGDWDTVKKVRSLWDGPLIVKGIMTPGDAEAALDAGVDGIYVSNHGGRQLDGLPASLRALPLIADKVNGRAAIVLDGGVQRGADVVKARALGATACFIGRAWFLSLAVAGRSGVAHMLSLLEADIERTLGLLGVARFDELTRECVDLTSWSPTFPGRFS